MADWDTAEAGYSAELMGRAGAAAPATFGEIWNANWRATGLDTLTGSGQPLEDAFNKLVDTAGARLGPIPQAARNAGLDYIGARGFAGKALVIQKLAATLPEDQQKEIEPLLDFRARAAETAAKLERDASDINGRTYGLSGNATAWLAGVARQMVDPVNVALLPAGGGEGGLLLSAGRQALIAGLGQAAQEPVIQRNRGELGRESGLGQAAGDVGNVVAGTAALGLGLPLLFRGAAWAGRKAFARPEEIPAAPRPSAAPEMLALPPPSHFPRYDETLITPNYNAPLALPPPMIAPEILQAGRDLVGRLEGEQGASLPIVHTRALHLISEEAGLRGRDQHLENNLGAIPQGSQDAAEQLARLEELERQATAATGAERKALLDRRDELLADTTPEVLQQQAAPLEQRRVVEAERAAIAARLAAIGDEKARMKAEQMIARPITLGERMPVRKIVPHPGTAAAFEAVAPGDFEAAALLADRDVAIPGGAGVDEAAARIESGQPLPPRVLPPGVFPEPRSTTRFTSETAEPVEKPAAAKPAAAKPAAAAAISKKRGPAARPEETHSLFEFLARRGGLAPHPDLEAVLGGNPFVPGFGKLVRKNGMTLDRAREAAVEAGYFDEPGHEHGGVNENTINDLLDAVDRESRGDRQYRRGREPGGRKGELELAAERNRADLERHIDGELEDAGIKPGDVDAATRARVIEIMTREGESDPLVAFERAAMENTEHEAPNVRREEIDEIPGWDVADEGPAPGPGARDVAGREAAPGARPSERREADRGPREEGPAGLGNPQLAADAERALEDAGGDFHITIEDENGGVREISARAALAEAEEEAAAARELEACLGGIMEEDL